MLLTTIAGLQALERSTIDETFASLSTEVREVIDETAHGKDLDYDVEVSVADELCERAYTLATRTADRCTFSRGICSKALAERLLVTALVWGKLSQALSRASKAFASERSAALEAHLEQFGTLLAQFDQDLLGDASYVESKNDLLEAIWTEANAAVALCLTASA